MSNCLRKKESMMTENASDWIYQEAIEQRFTQDYGTFREALFHCVEHRVSDIFTALLFEMDYGKNMMMLRNERYHKLWITLYGSVIKDVSLDGINVAPQRIKEKFVRKFPFSKQLIQSHDVITTYGSQGKFYL